MGASSQTSLAAELQSLQAQIGALEQTLQQKDQDIQVLRQQNLHLTTQLDILEASSYALGKPHDLDEFLNDLLDLIIRVLRGEAGSLLLIDKETRELELVVARGAKAAEVKDYRLPLGEGIAGWVAAHNEPANVSDVPQDPRWQHQLSEALGLATQSLLCVPVGVRGEVLGVLEVINRQDGGPFTDEDEALLLALAPQAGLRIVQARLAEETEPKRADRGALYDIATRNTTGLRLNRPEALQPLLNAALTVCDAQSGLLCLSDGEAQELVVEAVAGPGTEAFQGQRLPLSDRGQRGREGSAFEAPGEHFPFAGVPPLSPDGPRQLQVPLQAQGRLIGLLHVFNKRGDQPFEEEDVRLLAALGGPVAVALENLRLYEEAQAKVKELTTVVEVGSLLLSELALDELLPIAMNLTTQVMRAEASSLMLLDQATQELVFHVALGQKGEEVKQFRLPLGEGIAGWVAQTGEPLLVNDVQADPRFRRDIAEAIDFPTQSIVCVPLKTREQIIGVIEVINRSDGAPFGPRDLDLLKALAAQMAIALENARLYTNLERLFLNTIASLAAAIDARDPYTYGHSQRVMEYALAIAEEIGYPAEDFGTIRVASLLHDIGKIGTTEGILKKPGRLSPAEFTAIRQHPITGGEILSHIDELAQVVRIVRHHHERFSGGGYPDDLQGEEIPLAARIVAVADALDAMTSNRPYRQAFVPETAMEQLRTGAGSQFDPQAVQAALRLYHRGLIPKV